MKRTYGWKPDLPDHRDFTFKAPPKPRGGFPKSKTRDRLYSPAYDQSNLGSCTGNAICGLMFATMKQEKMKAFDGSRLATYYLERQMEGTVSEDAGAYIRDGIKVMNKAGVADETLWPYVVRKFNVPPPQAYLDAAVAVKASRYERIVPTLDNLKAAIVNNAGFVFGFSVYESFESDAVARTGKMPMPGPKEQLLGGHAVCAVGYSDAKKAFKIRNSWGPDWGAKGYFWMPYAFITNTNLCDDFWTITQIN